MTWFGSLSDFDNFVQAEHGAQTRGDDRDDLCRRFLRPLRDVVLIASSYEVAHMDKTNEVNRMPLWDPILLQG